MTAAAQNGSSASAANPAGSGVALRFDLASGPASIPLSRLHHLAGYATLTGEPEDYFLGWLTLRGEWVPVFDLNRVVCDQATPIHFGSRIMVVAAGPESPTPYIGLLAAGVTDTVSSASASVEPQNLDGYLPMLYSMIPSSPAQPVKAL
jgi:chemotaxis signal transduction protein